MLYIVEFQDNLKGIQKICVAGATALSSIAWILEKQGVNFRVLDSNIVLNEKQFGWGNYNHWVEKFSFD